MRPLRLLIDGFGSYRQATEIDLSDVDFFVLTGPTGSGKSTVIDALCFALYGRVPRWGTAKEIRNALAPSTAECRVCLVFEAAGHRYAAARQLRRDARGQVHTKEARLDKLSPSVPLDADLTKILEATVEQSAEGPDDVAAGVTELLGIGYEHFTQCVLLPQGRFAEFLQAKPADRQDLLIELLAYAVYEQVGQRARERGRIAATRLVEAEARLARTPEVTDEDIATARGRVADLAGLVDMVDDAVADMRDLRERWTAANGEAGQAKAQLTTLAELRTPPEIGGIAAQLSEADNLIVSREAERIAAEAAEAEAEQASAGLPELVVLTGWRDDHAAAIELKSTVDQLAQRSADAARDERTMAESVTVHEGEARRVDLEHRAAAFARELRVGEPCPVCRQVVGALPEHDLAADVDEVRRAFELARSKHESLVREAAQARAESESAHRQLTVLTARLSSAPAADELADLIAKRHAAEKSLTQARKAAKAARTAADKAKSQRASLARTEQRAWADLRASRDRFVALAAPAVDGNDLAVAWQLLVDWAKTRHDELSARADELAAVETELRDRGTAAARDLTKLLADHGVTVTEAGKAPVELATHRERANRDLDDLVARRKAAAELAGEVARHREEQKVADMLGQLLRSNQFERWLCAEALDSLVMEASQTLLQLSGGQYELYRGDKNDLAVVDHNDAGTLRPVHTLSGGETFQASLALALALSRQVVGLSGGKRDLNSMFLDEGFGTLDEETLDTVAATLEKLAQETDRMVGIVTHVPALAERVPVQFAVRRQGASSTITRVGV
jgi:exonuclease SbcC